MRINQDRTRNNPGQLTHEEMRRRCRFWLKRMAKPADADDINRKKQFTTLDEMTRLGVRRVEKLFRGYIPKPNALDYETIKLKYGQWLLERKSRALSEADDIEDEYAEFQNAVADYSSERWARVSSAGHGDRALGKSSSG